jgi:nitrilase
MSRKLKLAVAQSRTLDTVVDTLQALEKTTLLCAESGVDLILFPEAYLGGYPRTCNFGVSVGDRELGGRNQFLEYFKSAVDLGDTPAGEGDAWVERTLPIAKGANFRGDGTREELERIARDSGVFIVTGLVEKSGGSLYCAVVYVCPKLGMLGKRRKIMPTGTERLIWAQGSPSTLRAVTTTIRDVKLTLAALICWESYMPLVRQSLYSQNVNLYLAPTADSRETWLPLMRTVGFEGRTFVLSANQCVKRKHLPAWVKQQSHISTNSTDGLPPLTRRRTSTITKDEDGHEICWPSGDVHQPDLNKADSRKTNGIIDESQSDPQDHETPSLTRRRNSVITETPEHHEICWPQIKPFVSEVPIYDDDEEYVSKGGSCIISPFGEILAGPIFNEDPGLLIVEADFDDCERGKLDLDVAVSRNDAFKLTVEGLDLRPPP